MSNEQAVAHLHDLAITAQRAAAELAPAIQTAATMVRETVARGGTLFFCGNGGSAADAQHVATEYVVRFARERRAIAAVALTTDTSVMTAAGNDYGFDRIFARQVEALCRPADLLVIHSTSGNSPNLLRAAESARAKGVPTLALLAKGGGQLAAMVDHCIIVPTDRTDRAQELHLNIQHAICEMVDADVGAESAHTSDPSSATPAVH
jgi:D-sedoheptulose 7-phosphate isomerase